MLVTVSEKKTNGNRETVFAGYDAEIVHPQLF